MKENITMLKKEFITIKNKGWIKSMRSGSTGIGITFENLLGTPENNLELPDYNGIEIKTKRSYSSSYTTLFNCTPEGPNYHEVKRLKDKYGYPDFILKNHNVINNSVFADKLTKIGRKYYFKLVISRKEQKIFLYVFDIHCQLIEKYVYWTFKTLKEKLYRKLKTLAFVYALRKIKNNIEYFKYYRIDIYTLKDFDNFINLIEEGIIRVTFTIGVFRKGSRIGEIHDHGTAFQIKENDLTKLFELYNKNE